MQRYTILWADDEIDLLKPHILFLQQRGYDITPVNNGAEAVELSDSKHFDVVFLDEHMPGMSGLELLPKAKAMRPDVPIIMITAYGDADTKRKALESGAEAFLTKPIDFGTLRSEIDMRVERAA